MRVEGRQLRIVYDNAAQYLTADNCAVGVKSYGNGVVIKSTALSGYANFNSAAKAVLFPNAKAHPVKADSHIGCGASTNNKNNYCSLEFGGIEVHKVLCSNEVGELDGLTSAAITGAASATVSDAGPWDGDNVTFTATLAAGAAFDGWYSDAACTQRVSTSLSYTTTAADLTLYAKATQAAPTGTGVYIKRAGTQIQAAAVWRKANGLWAKSDKTAIEAGKNYRLIQR